MQKVKLAIPCIIACDYYQKKQTFNVQLRVVDRAGEATARL